MTMDNLQFSQSFRFYTSASAGTTIPITGPASQITTA